jgi:hypothetical protein
MFPELVVVWAAVTETVGLEIVKLPAAFVVAETVAVPVVLRISTRPREVIGPALVIPVEALSRTVPALIAPVPVVLTVDVELVIAKSPAADMVDVELLV